ncbi:mitogen-activated protein kinase kinase kinase, putative [Entamoeba dispar SAW760]|uniref:Mitogen-activated protein kinase kinase kinase, putative n=1 Tax=Entamoeba dispar (strain ATCC PRA-260 / SAW760) TaxID=370354 RepID=B0EPS3_ENTDS|nr:mitogen-activated protein kinase kinase kinase, putative [Entamoeba dispar SAW760]EDR23503.1 mitogen-activated protein kinase kinase kinase, putative [Entamoeba dispar SAW760]|eukprot:EDR23503.1 mitogen-activated protein kinase kinase kinase, putative [Entamoeba dispar SAW760]
MNSLHLSRAPKSSRRILDDMLPPFIGKYTRGLLLGETELGLMYSGFNTTTKEIVSLIHVINPEYCSSEDSIRKTVEYLFDKDIKKIIQYKDVVQVEGGFTFIIIDYFSLGQLSDYINMFVIFPEHIVKIIAMQYILLIEALTNAHIVYNKLSLINSFVSSKGIINCIGLLPPSIHKISTTSKQVIPDSISQKSSLEDLSSTTKDVWNLGIVLIELLTGRMIYDDYTTTPERIFDTITLPNDLSYECREFLICCLEEVPSGKLSIESLRNHLWLEDVTELHSEILSLFTEFLEDHIPYENYNFNADSLKPGTLFVNVCPFMKLVTDQEIEDFEILSDLSLTYVMLEKIMQDICMSDNFEDDEKETLTCLVEEITKCLQTSEIEVNLKPSQISYDEVDSTIINQSKRIEAMQQQVESFNERNKILVQEIEKIENFLIETKTGVELLATSLFGKLTPQKINGEKEGNLLYLSQKEEKKDVKKDKGISEKSWKLVWVVIKYTFIFVFKSRDDTTLIETFMFKPGHFEIAPEARYGKKLCFYINGHVFAAPDEQTNDEWKKCIDSAVNWYSATD